MPKSLLLSAALLCSVGGVAWLALAMEEHWQQVRGHAVQHRPRTVTSLRALGVIALLASLLLCLRADHATMAVLVWVMSLAAGSLVVALTLAWRPRWLAFLALWAGRG